MSKVQTRKSVSISGRTYDRFVEFCRARGKTMSGVTEALLAALTGDNDATAKVLLEVVEGGRLKEVNTPFALFPKSAPNPGTSHNEEKLGYDPQTVAHRKHAQGRLF